MNPGMIFKFQETARRIAGELGRIVITVQSIKGGKPNRSVEIEVSGKTVNMTGSKQDIRIPVENIPEGESRNFSYTVTVRERGLSGS